jgi:hypothetical protein
LTNVTFSYGISYIGDYSFLQNPLTNLTLPGSVTYVGDQAFFQCSLQNVIIGAGVTSLGSMAFAGNAGLNNVFFLGNAPAYGGGPDAPVYVFDYFYKATAYYLPGTTGWSSTYQGIPAVLWNPLIQTTNGNFGVQNNQFGFNITGTTNISIVVQACTNLANPVWTPLTNVTLTNGLFHFSEPVQPNTPARYYGIGFP